MTAPDPILVQTVMRADGRAMPVDLTYDESDPAVVRMTFPTAANSPTWRIGRELLADGMESPSGDGDVRIESAPYGRMTIALQPGPQRAVLDADMADISDLLVRSYGRVPFGEEYSDADLEQLSRDLSRHDGPDATAAAVFDAHTAVERLVADGYDVDQAGAAVVGYVADAEIRAGASLAQWGLDDADMEAIRADLGADADAPISYRLADSDTDEGMER